MLHALAELGEKRALPYMRSMAESDAGIQARLAAIAALGRLGEENDLELLRRFAQSSDSRLRLAASSAMAKWTSVHLQISH